VSAPGLLPIERFTQEHVDACFGFGVKESKFKKMETVHHLWHQFHDRGIAYFQFDGPHNVWGFRSVHVVDRETWAACVLATGRGMARNVGGKPAAHPVQSIYEIMQYCGMTVVRRARSKSKQPRAQKALDQDDYVFDEKAFQKKHRTLLEFDLVDEQTAVKKKLEEEEAVEVVDTWRAGWQAGSGNITSIDVQRLLSCSLSETRDALSERLSALSEEALSDEMGSSSCPLPQIEDELVYLPVVPDPGKWKPTAV
jgi:hypothetical protein